MRDLTGETRFHYPALPRVVHERIQQKVSKLSICGGVEFRVLQFPRGSWLAPHDPGNGGGMVKGIWTIAEPVKNRGE